MPFRDLPGATLCHFSKGDILIGFGQEVTHIYYLVKGIVYRELSTEGGNETVVTVKSTGKSMGALVGVIILYREGHISTTNFIAKTDCTCYKIPREEYLAVANKDPKILLSTIEALLKEHTYLMDLYNGKRDRNAASRLCAFLLAQSHEHEGELLVSGRWSNVEMSKFLGVHTVTVARILKVLKETGCVSRTENGLLIMDVERLMGFADNRERLQYRYEP